MAEELLLLEEVARECRAPLSSVRHWIRTGRLQSIRPGRRRLVRRGELERFLASDSSNEGASAASESGDVAGMPKGALP